MAGPEPIVLRTMKTEEEIREEIAEIESSVGTRDDWPVSMEAGYVKALRWVVEEADENRPAEGENG